MAACMAPQSHRYDTTAYKLYFPLTAMMGHLTRLTTYGAKYSPATLRNSGSPLSVWRCKTQKNIDSSRPDIHTASVSDSDLVLVRERPCTFASICNEKHRYRRTTETPTHHHCDAPLSAACRPETHVTPSGPEKQPRVHQVRIRCAHRERHAAVDGGVGPPCPRSLRPRRLSEELHTTYYAAIPHDTCYPT